MSVEAYEVGDLFTIRTVKSLAANPENAWANSYEVRAKIAGSQDELLALGNKLIMFERIFHLTVVNFVQVSISTWEADSVPYLPNAFISSPLASAGLRVIGSDQVSLNQTLSVARVPLFGRFGHLFYRGVLTEIDVASPAGKSILANKPEMVTQIDDAAEAADMANYIGVTAAELELVMISKTGTQVRAIQGLVPVGVSSVPNDHAWYNRTGTP